MSFPIFLNLFKIILAFLFRKKVFEVITSNTICYLLNYNSLLFTFLIKFVHLKSVEFFLQKFAIYNLLSNSLHYFLMVCLSFFYLFINVTILVILLLAFIFVTVSRCTCSTLFTE